MDARILVVDDEPEIADLVEVYLKSEGCTVFKCGTGTEALAVVHEKLPFPECLGRVCAHPCESECRHGPAHRHGQAGHCAGRRQRSL